MAPKRKRPGSSSADVGDNRPSPHRPGNTHLGQHDRRSSLRGQGGQYGGRGRGRRDESYDNLNRPPAPARTPTASGPISPALPVPSSVTQPSQSTASPIQLPKRELPPFDYSVLTEDRFSSWETSGRDEVVACGIQARQNEDILELGTTLQELIRAGLDGRLEASVAGDCVKDILKDTMLTAQSAHSFDPQSFFLDTFSMIFDSEEGNFNPLLRPLILASGIPAHELHQKLDGALLQKLGFTRDTFTRVGIRQATHLLYKQANYNLLREETEGYSKLVTELFTTSGSEPPTSEVVEDAFERVKGLIGTFDLDVGRVLDITLDVFAAVLIKHYRFFIKLLRVSSWWPRSGETDSTALTRCTGLPKWALPSSPGWSSTGEDGENSKQQRVARDIEFWTQARKVGLDAFFQLGGRQAVDEETKKRIRDIKSSENADADPDHDWIKTTGTFPPLGNRTAAHLLGFKLRFYTSPARDKDDVLPANLIYLTALLIKIGFISLRDLYAHLWPLDADMPAVREAKSRELQEKEKLNRQGGGATNALMMAGALPDDTLPNGGRPREAPASKTESAKLAPEAEDNDTLEEPADQKVQLLTCLLVIGAIPESLFILGRFPWLPEAYPELYDLIHRLLHYSIDAVYHQSQPLSVKDPSCPTKKIPDFDQGGAPKGQVRLTPIPVRKQLRWPFPDKFDTNENNSYRFYWDEWADNVPVCQTVDDVFTLCSTLLNFSGINIGRDSALLSKFARIGAKSLSNDASPRNLERWQDLLKRLLVPALSMTKSNTSAANEIYDMLRFYPVSIRYSIYAEWYEGQISRLPAMKIAFARTRLETLGTMKRISMTNLTTMARSLAKTAYASPGIVFSVALSQIEAYTNLTEVVVECAKYFTDLGYDVLVWSLMSSLGGKDRNRNNAEFALLPSRWLLALSRFSGKVFKRYSIMNLSPIIQYVNDQLYRGNSTDLVILKELIAQMAGVVPDTDFTDAQLTAMTGGEALKKQTLINLQDKRYESVKTSKRLMKALTETKLAGQLLLSIAQHRQAAIYKISDEDAHIKLLATMIDDSQMILFQYLDLLRSNLSIEDFDSQVPAISELLTDFGLDTPFAFMIGRTSVARSISKSLAHATNGTKSPQGDQESSTTRPDGSSDSAIEVDKVESLTNGKEHTPVTDGGINGDSSKQNDVTMAEINESSSTVDAHASELVSSVSDPSQDILQPIINSVTEVLPDSTWKAISPEFYVTFWILTLGDLSIPHSSYQIETQRLIKEEHEVMKDRSDMSRTGMIRRDEAKKTLEKAREDIMAEFRTLISDYAPRKARLLKRKAFWFSQVARADAVSDVFFERCLFPRLILSPSDADYCFKMIKFLHENGTPNFRTLSLYGRLFKPHRLRSLIFTCSVREAENLGRFFRLILTDLARWHGDRTVYEKEAWGQSKTLIGFVKAVDGDGTPKGFLDHGGKISFQNVLLSWHKNLNIALRDCLDGTEWMHIRNAITVLKSVVEVFPTIDFMGTSFIKQLEVIAKREKDVREDLSLTGNAVLVQLKKKSKSWVMVQAFGYNMVPEPAQIDASTSKTTSSSPRPKKTLSATAPDFKPISRASSVGAVSPKPQTAAEVEDGEVDDAKTSSGHGKPSTGQGVEDDATIQPATTVSGVSEEPKRSEVLTRRDQILRDKELKSSTPSPSLPPVLPRTEPLRNNPVGSLPERPNHSLPSRPEAPFPGRQQLDRHSMRHSERRDGREPRIPPDVARIDRPGEWSRDFSGGDRRAPEVKTRDFGRPSDRGPTLDRDRVRPDPPPRWTPDSVRDPHDRPLTGIRAPDQFGRSNRDTGMPPPRSSLGAADRLASVNHERAPLPDQDRQELINPERAALIAGGNASSRSDSPRRSGGDRARPSSRPQSPRRHGGAIGAVDSSQDDRPGRNAPVDLITSQNYGKEFHSPLAGPRGEHSIDRGGDRVSVDRYRDSQPYQPTNTPLRSADLDSGRTNSSPQSYDVNFGRLNPVAAPEAPSGPRDRNPRGTRTPQGGVYPERRDTRNAEAPRPSLPETKPSPVPTGPSRHPRHSGSQFEGNNTQPTSLSNTPAATPPTIGVHPDRLRQLDPQVVAQAAPAPLPPPIHPDRLRVFEHEGPPRPPPTHHYVNNQSRSSLPSISIASAPGGPKAPHTSPMSSVPNGMAAPTGPASQLDRSRSGRRQLTGINTMLQQAGQQNGPERVNPRGRGRFTAHSQPETPVSGQSTPVLPGPLPYVNRPEPMTRDASRDLLNPERADLFGSNLIAGASEDLDHGGHSTRRERSGRHSRRSSRSPDRTRDSRRAVPDDERSSRGGHRERRGGERGDPGRERHQGRSTPPRREFLPGGGARDVPANAEALDGSERERERQHGRDRGGQESGNAWGGGPNVDMGGERSGERGGRRSDRRGDDTHQRESREMRSLRDEGGRKRRSDEGGMDPRGGEKRPRR